MDNTEWVIPRPRDLNAHVTPRSLKPDYKPTLNP